MIEQSHNNINDQQLQSFGLKLKPRIQNKNLIIEAYNLDDQLQYAGKIEYHRLIIFQDFIEMIKQGKFQTLQKSQHHHLKIRIGVLIVVLHFVDKSQEKLKELKNEKNDFQVEINSLKNQLIQLDKKHQKNIIELQKKLEKKSQYVLNLIKQRTDYEIQLMHEMAPKQEIQMKEQKPFDLTPLGLPISEIRWSRKFSTRTKIIGNIVSQLQQPKGFLSILQTGFSKEIKKKQLWALKIKSQISLNEVDIRADFGITLIENKDYDLQQIGHGRYGISLNGYCFSHSHEDFNCVFRSFDIDSGDVIYLEYDPIQWKMRFQRNQNGPKFEMPITPPPENDAYHPYFELQINNKAKGKLSVELMLPGRLI